MRSSRSHTQTLITGTLVTYTGKPKQTCEDHRNRSYPLHTGAEGQIVRKLGNDLLVRWDLTETSNAMPTEWHTSRSVAPR